MALQDWCGGSGPRNLVLHYHTVCSWSGHCFALGVVPVTSRKEITQRTNSNKQYIPPATKARATHELLAMLQQTQQAHLTCNTSPAIAAPSFRNTVARDEIVTRIPGQGCFVELI